MKIISLLLLGVFVCLASSHMQLRRHDIPFLDSLNPLETASLMTGDYSVIFPEFMRPMIRKITGQEQQGGVSGFLSKAQGLMGGGNSNGGGMLGGLGGLLSGGGESNSGNGVLSGLSNMMGGGQSQKK